MDGDGSARLLFLLFEGVGGCAQCVDQLAPCGVEPHRGVVDLLRCVDVRHRRQALPDTRRVRIVACVPCSSCMAPSASFLRCSSCVATARTLSAPTRILSATIVPFRQLVGLIALSVFRSGRWSFHQFFGQSSLPVREPTVNCMVLPSAEPSLPRSSRRHGRAARVRRTVRRCPRPRRAGPSCDFRCCRAAGRPASRQLGRSRRIEAAGGPGEAGHHAGATAEAARAAATAAAARSGVGGRRQRRLVQGARRLLQPVRRRRRSCRWSAARACPSPSGETGPSICGN